MSKNQNFAVILAGGSGTRFWPLSRQSQPKQFLKIIGANSLFQETLKRMKGVIPSNQIYIVTNKNYKKEIVKQAKSYKLPTKNILLEPSGKNTAPAICWATHVINRVNPNAIISVLPSDHLITEKKRYVSVLRKAFALAKKDFLVTFGIVPTRPETGYGYLKTGKKAGVLRVLKFTEKPNAKKAQTFLRNKSFLWNSGMFVFKASVMLEEFEAFLPKINNILLSAKTTAQVYRRWNSLKSISIDYGILEKSKRVAAVAANHIGWSDLGSWESLADILTKNKQKTYSKGNVIDLNNKDTFILSDKKLIAAVGLKDIIIVDSPDALLICPKSSSQAVREIVSHLKHKKQSKYI